MCTSVSSALAAKKRDSCSVEVYSLATVNRMRRYQNVLNPAGNQVDELFQRGALALNAGDAILESVDFSAG